MDYSQEYDPEADFDLWYTRAALDVILAFVRPGDRIIELGCGTGVMTAAFVQAGAIVTAIDHSTVYLERARERGLERVTWTQLPLDEWTGDATAEHVVATSVLHEVQDPQRLLNVVATALVPGGLVHITLQNPLSIHRQVAREMGLIDSVYELSDRGRSLGTRGMWDLDELTALATRAGLRRVLHTGLVLKPLPNALMAGLPEDVIEGFVRAAGRFGDVAAMNYLLLSTNLGVFQRQTPSR
jgi:ubiquinone/menaquinone biosynthesis C-methylase UbiE